jgi:hypothetical protein
MLLVICDRGYNGWPRIGSYLIGGAIIMFGLVVIAAVLAGAVWMAVSLR